MPDIHKILEEFWGYKSFRPLQEDIIRSVLNGKDTLGLMPTGGGKSLTFQVPTMAMDGICIVVTPLIALMKDQVDNLRARGIKATTVYTGMTREEIIKHLDNCIYGNYKFLYISPERLGTELFRQKMTGMNVCLLTVDESHCISQWGYDFRPSYLKIADIRKLLPENIPVLALTATATPEVVDDIQDKLMFKKKNVMKKSFVRENLSYVVRKTDNKTDELIHILKSVPGTAIVYVRNRKHTQEIAKMLMQEGFSANYFHAGLNREEKTKRQDAWKNNSCRIMVATNAFGMGIDKPDVRIVVHINMPNSLEEYFQEAGRAGRDEKRAYAVALISSKDTQILKTRLTNEYPNKQFILKVYDSLCNYYQIAAGFGSFVSHDFPINDFCRKFKLPEIQTLNALKTLEHAGYLELEEYPDNKSRLLFLVNRHELYKYDSNALQDIVIQNILRLYSGLFADYVFIDESVIATYTHSTREEVYNVLIMLSKMRIISYIPHKQMPQIMLTRDREETKYIIIPKSIYEVRQERSQKRIDKVIEYITEERRCRTRLLLEYFGEKSENDCRTCDICLKLNSSGLHNWEISNIRNALKKLVTDKPHTVQSILKELPLDTEKNIKAIRYLTENDENIILDNGTIKIL